MHLTGRTRFTLTTAATAVVVLAASTLAGQGEPAVPGAGSATLVWGAEAATGHTDNTANPVIHVPAVRVDQAQVGEPKGTPPLPASALARLDIPPTALLAYQRAAVVMAQADRSCRLSWTLLAAIGRVESDHGRYAGALLGTDGVSTPVIRGVALDGRGPVARIPDTDGGQLDGDPVWDHAVGPMQFLPSTWAVVAVDGDGDGVRSPDDLDDAALGAAVFLCSGQDDLGTEAGRRAAVHRYNPSDSYVASVLAVEAAYRTGDYELLGRPMLTGPVQVAVSHPDRSAPQPAVAGSGPSGSPGPPGHHGGGGTPGRADHQARGGDGPRQHQSHGQPKGPDGTTRSPHHGTPSGPGTTGPTDPTTPSDPTRPPTPRTRPRPATRSIRSIRPIRPIRARRSPRRIPTRSPTRSR